MVCVCVHKTENIHLLQSFVHHLAQPKPFKVTWRFSTDMMMSVLEHCMFKDLPDGHSEHPSVSLLTHNACTLGYRISVTPCDCPCCDCPCQLVCEHGVTVIVSLCVHMV